MKIDVIKIQFFDGSTYLCRFEKGVGMLIINLEKKKKRELLLKPPQERARIMKAAKKRIGGLACLTKIKMEEEEYNKIPLVGAFRKE